MLQDGGKTQNVTVIASHVGFYATKNPSGSRLRRRQRRGRQRRGGGTAGLLRPIATERKLKMAGSMSVGGSRTGPRSAARGRPPRVWSGRYDQYSECHPMRCPGWPGGPNRGPDLRSSKAPMPGHKGKRVARSRARKTIFRRTGAHPLALAAGSAPTTHFL